MTRALVVHHDIDLADQEVESLRRFGYQVEQCSGPTANTCPVLNGGRCQLAEDSDVLVYDAWADGDSDGSTQLIKDLRRVHPQVPIVLTFPGIGMEGFDDEPTHGVDVGTKAAIHEIISNLAAQGLSILMISSELPEILGMSDRVLVMREGRLVAELSRAEATPERVIAAAAGMSEVAA